MAPLFQEICWNTLNPWIALLLFSFNLDLYLTKEANIQNLDPVRIYDFALIILKGF